MSGEISSVSAGAQVTVNSVLGTAVGDVFSFDGPAVTAAFTNTPVSGGALVTLIGLHFGSADYSPTVYPSNRVCSCTSWSTTTLVTCSTNPLYTLSSSAAITLSSTIGTTMEAFSWNAPLGSNTLQNVAASGGSVLTLLGLAFGVADWTATADVGQPCETTEFTSGTSLRCTTRPVVANTVTLVTVAGQVGKFSQLSS